MGTRTTILLIGFSNAGNECENFGAQSINIQDGKGEARAGLTQTTEVVPYITCSESD